MRIDSHVHILPPDRQRSLVRWLKRAYPKHPVPEDADADWILNDLKAQGIEGVFNFAFPLKPEQTEPLLAFNRDLAGRRHGVRIWPFASLHVETPNLAELTRRAVEDWGLIGVKLHPFVQKFELWDSRLEPMYDTLNQLGAPLITHTGFDAWYRQEMPADKLEALLRRYPNMPAVFVHMIFPHLGRAFAMLDDYERLWLDATNVPGAFRFAQETGADDMPALRRTLEEGLERCAGRVMYGSDHPVGMGSAAEIHRDPWLLNLSEPARTALTGGAAEAFLRRYAPPENE